MKSSSCIWKKYCSVFVQKDLLKKMGQRQKGPGCICIPNIMLLRRYEKNLLLTINVENFTKLVKRMLMSNRPEIDTHGMRPRQVAEKTVTKKFLPARRPQPATSRNSPYHNTGLHQCNPAHKILVNFSTYFVN
jgi:hypothetical protein